MINHINKINSHEGYRKYSKKSNNRFNEDYSIIANVFSGLQKHISLYKKTDTILTRFQYQCSIKY